MRACIGFNLGDVIVDVGDLYGEGVNIAARLQALAQPGGIILSETVREHVAGELNSRQSRLATAICSASTATTSTPAL